MRLVNREIVDAQASSRHFFIDTLAKLDLVKANGYGGSQRDYAICKSDMRQNAEIQNWMSVCKPAYKAR